MSDQQSLTVTELMKRWSTGRNVVCSAIKNGRLKAFRLGTKKLRVTLAEVERFEATGGFAVEGAA